MTLHLILATKPI